MRWLASICALFIGVSVSGCAIIEAEKNNRGGFLDQVADDLWMKADSKKMRALRALTLEVSLARIAMIAPKSAPDRALLARRIGQTSVRADVVRRCAFFQLQIPGQASDEPCFFFDSVMVDYENALFDLALIALPIDDAKNLITRVTGGIAAVSVNPLELVQTLVDIGREAFRYGRVVGAIYRDTLELEVQVWLASPDFAGAERARGVPEQFVVTDEKVASLRAAYVRGNDNIPVWRAAIADLRAQGLEPVPDQRFIREIYHILGYICGQIVNESDPAYEECKQSKLMQNLPVATSGRLLTTGLGGTVFRTGLGGTAVRTGLGGTAVGVGTGGAGQRERETGKQSSGKTAREGAQTDFERNMKRGTLLDYKAALCVTGENATKDNLDTDTRERLQQLVGGYGWGDLAQAIPTIDSNLALKLKDGLAVSRDCKDPIRNAYELGVYARAGADPVEKVMSNALAFLKLNDARRGREAIGVLKRSFLQPTQPSGQTATTAAEPAELDPALWKFVQEKARCHLEAQQPPVPGMPAPVISPGCQAPSASPAPSGSPTPSGNR
jgi:hypothetical protein